MSFGDLGARIELDVVNTGTNVASDINRELQLMESNARALHEMFRDGAIGGAELVTTLGKMSVAYAQLKRDGEAYASAGRQAMDNILQAQKDMAAVQDALGRMDEKTSRDRIEQLQREAIAQREATEAFKAESDAWVAGFQNASKLNDAKANLEAATRRLSDADRELHQSMASQVGLELEHEAALRQRATAVENFRRAQEMSIVTNGANATVERDLKAAEDAVYASEVRLNEVRERMGIASQDVADKTQLQASAARAHQSALGGEAQALVEETNAQDRSNASKIASVPAMQNAGDQSMRFTRAAFYASQGLQDLEYGFSAVVNNIPLFVQEITRAMGGTQQMAMAISATAAIGATLIDVVGPRVVALFREFAMADADKMYMSMERIEQKLKDLKSQSWFVTVDYRQVEELEERLRRVKAAKSAFDAANSAQTEEQMEAGRRVRHAVVESAGGTDEVSGTKNLADAMEAFRNANKDRFKDDELFQKQQELTATIKRLTEEMKQPGMDAATQAAYTIQLRDYRNDLNRVGADIRKRDEAGLIGRALQGNETEIQNLRKFIDADPNFFANRGIGPQFRTEIEAAGRGQVRSDIAEGNRDPAWKSKQTQAREKQKAEVQKGKDAAKEGKRLAMEAKKQAAEIAKAGKERLRMWANWGKGAARDSKEEEARKKKAQAARNKADMDDIHRLTQAANKATSPGMVNELEGFALDQNMKRERDRQLATTPEGRQQLAQQSREAASRRRAVQRQIDARDRSPEWKKKFDKMTELEKRDQRLKDELALQGDQAMTTGQQRDFTNRRVANDLQRTGAAGNDVDARVMAAYIAKDAAEKMKARLASFVQAGNSIQEAQMKVMLDIAAMMANQQKAQQRHWNALRQIHNSFSDMRQTNQDLP